MTLPNVAQAATDANGHFTAPWRNWLAALERANNGADTTGLQTQIAAIATALGSPDGSVAGIPDQSQQSLTTTDQLPEGANHPYFTEQRVRDTTLTGLSLASGADVVDTDTLIAAIGKLQAQVDALGSGGSAWTTVKKTSATSRASTTTLTDDAHLYFDVPAAGRYVIRTDILYDLASQTAGMSWQFAFSGTSANNAYYRNSYATNGNAVGSDNDFTHSNVGLPSGSGTGNTWPNLHIAAFIVLNATSAGRFSFQWAQAVSNALATEVRAGSYLEWMAS